MKTVVPAAVLACALCACAANRVNPVAMEGAKEVCIIENPRVRPEFLQAYQNALREKGYEPRVLPPAASLGECAVISKYVAYWAWDMVLYMSSAELEVYKNGRPAGRALFRARSSRFINAEDKVRELVAQLYK